MEEEEKTTMMIVRRTNVITNIIGQRVNNNCFTSSSSSISSSPILKFPSSLLSLDLPDIWPPSSPAIKNCCTANDHPSSALVIDGKLIAGEIRFRIAEQVRRMKDSVGKVPGLAVILVGDRRDSLTYVRNKVKACEDAGIKSLVTQFPQDCKQDDVIHALSAFNEDPSIHGILVQLPLPQHLDEGKILNVLKLEKDVDGFHPLNMGNLAMRGREPLFIPCTPKGCIELLIRSSVEIMGKNAVVIGRSNIVGLPISLLLQRHHATVTIVHAFTKNPEQIAREADIVVTATGVPNLVRGNWLKPGAVVIDVGTFPVEDPSCENGYRLIGDVCYEEASKVASAITPVPGGVGPMTIAMLLSNTLDSAKRAYDFT